MKTFFYLTFLLSAPAALFGQGEGGFAGAFLKMGLGARATALGGALTAVADDGFAAYFNPAGLPYLEGRRFATSYSALTLDRKFHFISYSQSLKPTAGLSIFWLGAGTNNIDGRDLSGNHTFDYSEAMNSFGISFANKFTEYLSFGISFKILQQDFDLVDDKLDSDDLSFDAGIMIVPIEDLRFGVMLKDFYGNFNWNTQDIFSLGTTSTDTVPYTVNVGVSYFAKKQLLISAAAEFNEHQQERFRIGLEYTRSDLYALRFGTVDDRISFGGGVVYKVSNELKSNLDYAFLTDIAGEGGTHLFSWEFIF